MTSIADPHQAVQGDGHMQLVSDDAVAFGQKRKYISGSKRRPALSECGDSSPLLLSNGFDSLESLFQGSKLEVFPAIRAKKAVTGYRTPQVHDVNFW